jgi:hypothetical protein
MTTDEEELLLTDLSFGRIFTKFNQCVLCLFTHFVAMILLSTIKILLRRDTEKDVENSERGIFKFSFPEFNTESEGKNIKFS